MRRQTRLACAATQVKQALTQKKRGGERARAREKAKQAHPPRCGKDARGHGTNRRMHFWCPNVSLDGEAVEPQRQPRRAKTRRLATRQRATALRNPHQARQTEAGGLCDCGTQQASRLCQLCASFIRDDGKGGTLGAQLPLRGRAPAASRR